MTPNNSYPSPESRVEALIVGGSLAGLVTGLALARTGVEVTVLERSEPDPQLGGGLGVNGAHLARVTGVTTFGQESTVQPWTRLRATLREAAEAHPAITLRHRVAVTEVGQEPAQEAGRAWATTRSGDRYAADLLIGADGHRSLVRRYVAPDQPDADFAGYVIWLGLVDEAVLSYPGRRPTHWDMLESNGDILFGVPLPGADGSTAPNQGRIGWAWYDTARNSMLEATGAVTNGVVQHSVRPKDVPEQTLTELAREASRWPRPWRDAILQSIADREVLGTPIAEYVPVRLAAGRLAIVGNAAHVPTPMTGQGFDASLVDAEVLAAALTAASPETVEACLENYEARRLNDARRLVLGGQRFSRSFVGAA
jgi:2-polyprenyl-6-methoxyphenol hydroxylase-like FAD-dependent oxidoreductase